ncbi:MAG: response regulator [Lachnospiraceae bacterium]|nr:response regulator [Lachnospiraceae bacterium]
MKKIGRRWYIITILCTIVALVVMVAYNYQMFYSNSVENMQAIGSSNLAQVAEELDGYLTRGMEAVQSTAVSVEYMMEQGATSADIEKFLVYESERYKEEIDENFTGIYGLFAGEYIDGIGWVPDADYDPKTREWYKKALEMGGEPTLVSPYLDAQTGTIMISVSELFRDGESVISLDIVMDRIQKITEGISINKGEGYGFVVDGNGLVVAHNNQQEKGKNYLQTDSEMKRLLEKVYAKDKNVFQMTLDGEEYTVFSDVVMEEWNVVMLVSNDKLFADSRTTLQRNIVICSLIAFVIILFLGITFARMNRSIQMEAQSNAKIEDMNQKVIRALVRTIDAKDRYTNGHSLRVAEYSREIARRMNKSEKEQDNIYYAGLLHDIGKIRVPEEVINKPGKLTDEEYDQIKIHPVTSYHILKDIYEDKQISMGAKFHHERYDGNGYPNGLKGENIPEIARIIGVADTYDAMASNRSYRKALPQDVVRSEIEKGKGSQFDPEIADVMLSIIDEDTDYKLKETNANVKTVLVVDDEAMNIKMVEIIMKNEPRRRIIGAQSGKEALEILEREEVNLILLDVTMPEMDGFETLERIREKYQIPVVFMTGDKNIETLERAAVYGVDDYLTKPFLPLALKEIIHAISW